MKKAAIFVAGGIVLYVVLENLKNRKILPGAVVGL